MIFEYFEAFPAAEELAVNVVTPDRQGRYEVQRATPVMTLSDN